jgi:hypothetical protein
MTDLAPVQVADWLVEPFEQTKAVSSNADSDLAAVRIPTTTPNKAAFFEPIEETGDIRIAADHSRRDFAAKQAIGCATEDTENVVLVRREVMLFEELNGAAGEQVDGAGEFDEDSLFGTRERFTGAGCGARHDIEDGRCNG